MLNHLLTSVPTNLLVLFPGSGSKARNCSIKWTQMFVVFFNHLRDINYLLDFSSVMRSLDSLEVWIIARNWKGSFGLTRVSNLLFNLGSFLVWFLNLSK